MISKKGVELIFVSFLLLFIMVMIQVVLGKAGNKYVCVVNCVLNLMEHFLHQVKQWGLKNASSPFLL